MGIRIDYKQFIRDRNWFSYYYTSMHDRTRLGEVASRDLEWGYLIDKSFGESCKPLYYVQSSCSELSHLWPFRWWVMGKLNRWV